MLPSRPRLAGVVLAATFALTSAALCTSESESTVRRLPK